MDQGDTIFALSSGALPAGVAVIRVSGPAVPDVIERIAGILPEPRAASLRSLRNEEGGLLDTGLVIYFPSPRSFTGEDCAELQVHGGPAVVAALLGTLAALPHLRPAEAGEFARRAFMNGKLDLTEAEALSDLIQAETEAQRRFALENGGGKHAALYSEWRRGVLDWRARVEAYLDFTDEDQVAETPTEELLGGPAALERAIREHAASFARAEIIRSGYRVVILGAPNAGKSSLLNALASRDIAIVTEEAGTTRDLVEATLDIEGMKVVVTDTAGIRDTQGLVERLGIERALAKAAEANLVISLVDGSNPHLVSHEAPCPVLLVGSKADLYARDAQEPPCDLRISSVTGQGVPELLAEVGRRARDAVGEPGPLPFRQRHVALLERCAEHLRAAAKEKLPEIRAEELRGAADELARITGTMDTEEVLGAIFGKFCIGK